MKVASPRRHRGTEKFFGISPGWFVFSVALCLRGKESSIEKAT
jgi:hypothetical protein